MKNREHLNSENTNNNSIILAIETSSSICGVCIYFNEEKFFQTEIHYKNIHAEKLFEIVDTVIKSAEIKVQDINAIAISNGPGSFTGLRIGMSAAKGLAFGSSIPIIQVPTFEALALQISKYLPNDSIFIIANKVNIDEVYFAKFQIKSNSYIFVENLRILSFSEFLSNSKDFITFGNALKDKQKDSFFKSFVFSPQPKYIAEWAIKYGKDKLSEDIDYIEPYYLKNFTVKVKKND